MRKLLIVILALSFLIVAIQGVAAATTFTTTSVTSLATAQIDKNKVVLAYSDETDNDISFSIYYTNGTVAKAETDVDQTAGGCDYSSYTTCVDVAALNSSNFVIVWYDPIDSVVRHAVYNSTGSLIAGPYGTAGVSNSYAVSVDALDSTHYVLAYYDDSQTDISYNTYSFNGTASTTITGLLDVEDVGASHGVSVAALNSTAFVIGFYDYTDKDVKFSIKDINGGAISSGTVDNDVGNSYSVSVAALNSTNFVLSYFDETDDDSTVAICNFTGAITTIDLDQSIGTGLQTMVSAAALNSSAFAVGWRDSADDDISFSTFISNGTQIGGPIDASASAVLNYLSVSSYSASTGVNLCGSNLLIAYVESTSVAKFGTYTSSGSAWDGVCVNNIPTSPTSLDLGSSSTVGATITATGSGSTDADGDSLTYYYEFYNVNDTSTVQAYSTTTTYTIQTTDAHNTIRVRTKAYDSMNYSGEYEANRSVSNTAPTTPTTLTLNSTIYVGQILTANASGSSDGDSDSLTYYYEFYNVDDAATRQAYSTTKTYTIQTTDAHNTIRVRTKAYDGYDYSGEKENTIAVSNTVPTNPVGLTLNATTIYVGQTLKANTSGSTDGDSDSVSYYYEFYNVNDSATKQAYSTTQTYTLVATDAHNTLRVRAKAYDGYTYSAGIVEQNISVSNSIPLLGNPSITPTSPKINDTLTCNAGSFTDADSDSEVTASRTWLWYKNNVTTGITTQTFTISGNAARFDNMSCMERTYDSYNYSNYANSTQLQIQNYVPIVYSGNVFTNETVGHKFNVTATAMDYDNGTDIINVNISITLGTCTQSKNSTSTTYFNVTFNCTSSSPGAATVQIGFRDTQGGNVMTTASSNTYINNAPTISSDTLTPTSPTIGQQLTGGCSGTDLDGDSLTYYYNFYSITDATYKGSFSTTNTYNLAAPLDSHDTFRVDCYASDGFSTSSTRTGTTQRTVANTPGTISSPTITPTPLNSTVTATCNHGGSWNDIDGDSEQTGSRQFLWYKNNVSTGVTTTTYGISNAAVGDWIFCHEKVYDGYGYSIQYNSTQYQVQDTPPIIQVPNTFVNNSVGHSFNVTAGVYDADGFADITRINITYTSGSCTNSKNSTSTYYFNATYNCSGTVGASAAITINFTDATGNSVSTTSSSNNYPNHAPTTPSTATLVPANIYIGGLFNATCSGSTDPDSDTITYYYRFYSVTDTAYRGTGFSSTVANYTITSSDVHDYIRVDCFANDTLANSSLKSSSSIQVNNTLPTTATLTTNSSLYVGQTLYANSSGSTDADSDSLTYYYAWYDVTAAGWITPDFGDFGYYSNYPSMLITSAYAHHTIQIWAKAYDGYGLSATASNDRNTTINNTAPTAPTGLTFNSTIYVGQILTANGSGATDTDGDTLTYYYEFYNINDTTTVQAYSTAATYTIASTDAHNTLRVRVKADDGYVNSSVYEQNKSINNTLPTTPTTLTLNSTIYVGQILTANASGSSDGDSDAVTYYYEFYNVDDASTKQAYSTTTTYTIATADAHNKIRVRSKAYDTYGYSGEKEANITIVNNIPTIGTPTLNNTTPKITDIVSCLNSTWADADGDAVQSYTYLWYKNNVTTGITTQTFTISGNAVKNDNLSCQIRGYDGYNYSNYANSTQSVVQNTAPIAQIQNTFVNNSLGHSFNVTAGVYDPDGFADITRINITYTSGSCTNSKNSTNTYYFNATYNCSGTYGNVATISINFTDASSGTISSTPSANGFPNHAPTTPTTDSILPATQTIGSDLTGTCSGSTDPDGDTITYYYRFYSVTDAAYRGAGFITTNTYTLTAPADSHDTFRIYCYANDTYTSSSTKTGSNTAIAANTIPTIGIPTLNYTTPKVTDYISCLNSTWTDADGDAVQSYTYLWYANNVSTGVTTQSTLAGALGSKGANLSCQVRGYDGYNYSNYANTTQTQILNSIPTIQVQNTFTNWTAGHKFNITAGIYDADGFADITRVNISTTNGTCTNSRNSTSGTYLNATFNCTGNSLVSATVIVGFTDASGEYISTTPSANTYPNQVPAWTQTITSATIAHQNNLAIQLNATDADGDTLFWQVNDSMVSVSQAGLLTDDPGILEAGTYNLRVNATDNQTGSVIQMNITYTITNAAPSFTQSPSTFNIYHSQNTSIQFNATDSNGDTITWTVNTTAVTLNQSGYMNATNSLSNVGYYSVKVTINDTQATSTLTFAYNILNYAPSFTQTPGPFSLFHNQNLTIQINATDLDGDTITWADNTSLFDINSTGYIFDNPTPAEAGNYSIKINITDTIDFNFITFNYEIKTSSPTWTQTPSSYSLFHSQNLSVQLNATDSDGDPLTWAVNDSMVTINQSGYLSDDPIRTDYGNHSLKINVTDGTTTINLTLTYEVKNYAPAFTQSPSSYSLFHNQNLSIQFNATDSDGDGLTWGTNSTLFTINLTGYVFDDPIQAETGNYSIKINVTDNTSVTSITLNYEVKNRAPSSGGVELRPTTATDATPLNCTTTVTPTDDDGDSITAYYKWYNNTVLTSITTFKVGVGNLTAGQKWQCEMISNDGLVNSSSAFSQEVILSSSVQAPSITYVNATTGPTGITSSTANPTKNNSWVNLSVTFTDANAGEVFTIHFCKTSSFNGTCQGGTFCNSTANITMTNYSCRYDVNPETTTSRNYWAFVMDNTSLVSNLQGTFYINYPPTRPTLSLANATWVNKNYTTLPASSTDPDGDTVTYHIYANTSEAVYLISSSTTTFNYTGLNETTYYWNVKANDSHGYESDLSEMYQFGVDYTAPIIENKSIYSTTYYSDDYVDIAMDCYDSFSGVNLSTPYYNLTDVLNINNILSMSYSANNRYIDIFTNPYPSTLYGFHNITRFFCQDNAGNSISEVGNLSFTTTLRPVNTGSAGGGGSSIIQTVIKEEQNITLLKFCGDNSCNSYLVNNKTYIESPGNCPADCKVNFDNLVTCTFTDPKTCFYTESWFVNLLFFLIIVGGILIYALENNKLYKGRKSKGDKNG